MLKFPLAYVLIVILPHRASFCPLSGGGGRPPLLCTIGRLKPYLCISRPNQRRFRGESRGAFWASSNAWRGPGGVGDGHQPCRSGFHPCGKADRLHQAQGRVSETELLQALHQDCAGACIRQGPLLFIYT